MAGLASTLVGLAAGGCSPGHLPAAPPPPTTSKTPRTSTSSTPAAATTTSTSSPPAVTTPAQGVSFDTNASAALAVGAQPTNWDVHSASARPWQLTLREVLAQVWPSAFYITPAGVPELNSALLTSATEVSTSPQTVVYQLNPKAVWSDGVPISYTDFVYNWQAQCGCSSTLDTGGAPFSALDKTGYDDIANVSGSATSPGAVTVTFSSPYGDWRSLFSYLVPAHVAQRVGFDAGFTDPVKDLVSGGPFMVAQAQDGYSLQLVRNARYWGTAADLASVTYYFSADSAEVANALLAGELDLATVPATPALYQQLQAVNGLSVQPVLSSLYEDLDFNERSGLLAQPVLRQAIMMAVDRTAIASDVLGAYGLAGAPVEDRVFPPGSDGYRADGSAYDHAQPAAALKLLAQSGYKLSSQALTAPGGQPVDLSLEVAADDPVAAAVAQQVAAGCAAIGITINLVRSGPAEGELLDGGLAAVPAVGWQMAIELRQLPVFASEVLGRYRAGGPQNVDGYASVHMQGLVDVLARAPASGQDSVYGQVDTRAWRDAVDLPLVQLPVLVVKNANLVNVTPGPYFSQLVSDEEAWGLP